jgi:hypothetical protein
MASATGHVKLAKRKRNDVWYVKFRRPDGRQVERKLGPAWTSNGRPPAGYYTRRAAEEALQAILTDLRRGIGAEGRSDATFARRGRRVPALRRAHPPGGEGHGQGLPRRD